MERALSQSKSMFDEPYKPTCLRNWEIPNWFPEFPCKRKGFTRIISNDSGNILPGIKRPKGGSWSNFQSTWHLPNRITRKIAAELTAPSAHRVSVWKRHCNETDPYKYLSTAKPVPKEDLDFYLHRKKGKPKRIVRDSFNFEEEEARLKKILRSDNAPKLNNEEIKSEGKKIDGVKSEMSRAPSDDGDSQCEENLSEKEPGKNQLRPYVPGDYTDPENRDASYYYLKAGLLDRDNIQRKGFPKTLEDYSERVKKILPPNKGEGRVGSAMLTHECKCSKKHAKDNKLKKLSAPIVDAIRNFDFAKKLHRENLEHRPLPDTLSAEYLARLRQIQDDIYAGGIAYKETLGYAPTKCTKMKIFRPKTAYGNNQCPECSNETAGNQFERKWRFFRKSKVGPMDLAVCWDLIPTNCADEPKRTRHIDGSNGSKAPAVFSMVHPAQELLIEKPREGNVEEKCDGLEHVERLRPKTACYSNKCPLFTRVRAQSAYALDIPSHAKSSPNLAYSHSCSKEIGRRVCVGCEAKAMQRDVIKRPKSEYKMAFKAGLPSNGKVSKIVTECSVPKPKIPIRDRCYTINSLAPPLSFQNDRKEGYPDYWRLSTVYQQSYKPMETRKRSLMASVYN